MPCLVFDSSEPAELPYVAQMVVQLLCKQNVAGLIPTQGASLKVALCSSV